MKLKLPLNEFGLSPLDVEEFEKYVLVKKFNWDYGLALNFQRALTGFVRETGKPWIIACSHPDVLTHGRGLQKARKGQVLALEDYNPSAHPHLPVPLFQIERGGGLTFHHPGQLIIYPIVRLHPQKLGLSHLVDGLLESVQESLQELGVKDLDHKRELLGLWARSQKLASVGIAIDRMVTLHGLALNVQNFQSLKDKLSFLAPCGMEFKIYTSVEELTGKKIDPEDLADKVIRRLTHAW